MASKKEKVIEQAPAQREVRRLQIKFKEEIIPLMMKRFNYKSTMQVPKLEKVVLNMRLGDIKENTKSMQLAVKELEIISGQKAVVTKAKKSVANFKIRQGQNVAAMVTLRADHMWDFFDKFVSIALPRVRDFRGTSPKAFDGRGNYAIGIKEQLIFPEISYDEIEQVRGFDIIFVTSAKSDEEAKELLSLLGMPFSK